jgi:hypothetical protein
MDGVRYQVNKPIAAIRMEYFKTFLDYKSNGRLSARQDEQHRSEKNAKEVTDMLDK